MQSLAKNKRGMSTRHKILLLLTFNSKIFHQRTMRKYTESVGGKMQNLAKNKRGMSTRHEILLLLTVAWGDNVDKLPTEIESQDFLFHVKRYYHLNKKVIVIQFPILQILWIDFSSIIESSHIALNHDVIQNTKSNTESFRYLRFHINKCLNGKAGMYILIDPIIP